MGHGTYQVIFYYYFNLRMHFTMNIVGIVSKKYCTIGCGSNFSFKGLPILRTWKMVLRSQRSSPSVRLKASWWYLMMSTLGYHTYLIQLVKPLPPPHWTVNFVTSFKWTRQAKEATTGKDFFLFWIWMKTCYFPWVLKTTQWRTLILYASPQIWWPV